jgi:hypothetical protein
VEEHTVGDAGARGQRMRVLGGRGVRRIRPNKSQ